MHRMQQETTSKKVRQAGSHVQTVILGGIAALVVLTMFGGLAFLVYEGRLEGGALLLYAGVILGYVIHATKQAV